MPTVTALRETTRGGVAVELDGAPWRVVPVDAAVRAGLSAGLELDREGLCRLARELRRSRALGAAAAQLRRRDLTRRALDERLARRGVGAETRAEVLSSLAHVGLVDDARVAAARALSLAERGWGDEAIVFRLRGEGAAATDIEAAMTALDSEGARAERIASTRGRGPSTARWLARRGFGHDAVETALGQDEA